MKSKKQTKKKTENTELPVENIKKPKKMPSHIEEYFAKIEGTKESFVSRELFQADTDGIDLKTHLTDQEISLINTLLFNNSILQSRGLKPVYNKWIEKFMRLKVSKDRLSRTEFVNANRQMTPAEELSNVSNLNNILSSKK